jgi:integrase
VGGKLPGVRGGSIERLPSGRYRARWYTRDGRHPSKSFTLKRDAETFLRRAIVDSERAGVDIAPKDETITTLIKAWWPSVERSVKPRTADRYREHLRTIERHPISREPLQRVDYAAAQAFVDALSAEYAPKTVAGIYGVFALIIKDAAKRGKTARAIPKPSMPRPRQPTLVIPTRDEVEQLAAASDARLHVSVLLAGFCGLRQGELLALHRLDVDLEKATVFVHQARNKASGAIESTKTDAARVVHLPLRVREATGEHMDEYDGAILFPVTASIFDKSWRHARTACNLTGVRFHDLRHAAASMMIHAGWNINQVSKQLGHANPTMTLNIYAHLWPDSFVDAIAKMDEYLAHD